MLLRQASLTVTAADGLVVAVLPSEDSRCNNVATELIIDLKVCVTLLRSCRI